MNDLQINVFTTCSLQMVLETPHQHYTFKVLFTLIIFLLTFFYMLIIIFYNNFGKKAIYLILCLYMPRNLFFISDLCVLTIIKKLLFIVFFFLL